MTMIAFFLLAAIAEPAAAQDNASAQTEPKKERLICKRAEASESRLGGKRTCLTARQWRDAQRNEGDFEVRRGRGKDGN